MDLVTEEDKYQKESEIPGEKESVKKDAESSIESTDLFNEIYEKNMGSKVSFGVIWIPLC